MITMQRRGRQPIGLAPLTHIPLIALVLFALGPLVLLVLNAFKTDDEANYNPIGWPGSWHAENFVRAWIDGGLGPAVRNSMIVSSATILGVYTNDNLSNSGETLKLLGSLDEPIRSSTERRRGICRESVHVDRHAVRTFSTNGLADR